jgi:hypothetical protein
MSALVWDRTGCLEERCYCHDDSAPPKQARTCSGCGCLVVEAEIATIEEIARDAAELATQATPGPWCVSGRAVITDDDNEESPAPVKAWICGPANAADSELIAHAGSHYGALAAEVLRLHEALRHIRQSNAAMARRKAVRP